MTKLKVGDHFVRLFTHPAKWPCHVEGYESVVAKVDRLGGITDEGGWYHLAQRIKKIDAPLTARRNDPATSKAAAKPKRNNLRQRVALAISGAGSATGKELAVHCGAPLNSVTPRLAELRRAGLIKDSGQHRDGQIVWVAA